MHSIPQHRPHLVGATELLSLIPPGDMIAGARFAGRLDRRRLQLRECCPFSSPALAAAWLEGFDSEGGAQ